MKNGLSSLDGRDEPISGFLGDFFVKFFWRRKWTWCVSSAAVIILTRWLEYFPDVSWNVANRPKLDAAVIRDSTRQFFCFCFIPIKVGQFFFNWKGPPGRASGGNTRKIKKRSTTSTNNNEINYLVGGKSLRPQLSSSSEILVFFKSIRFLLCTAVGLFKYIISIPLLPLVPCVF